MQSLLTPACYEISLEKSTVLKTAPINSHNTTGETKMSPSKANLNLALGQWPDLAGRHNLYNDYIER